MNGCNVDYVFYDEQSEFPPRDMDYDEFSQKLQEFSEKIGETLSQLGEYLQCAFSCFGDALRDFIARLPEIVMKKRQVFKPVKMLCILSPRKASHWELIPYYTGGFL